MEYLSRRISLFQTLDPFGYSIRDPPLKEAQASVAQSSVPREPKEAWFHLEHHRVPARGWRLTRSLELRLGTAIRDKARGLGQRVGIVRRGRARVVSRGPYGVWSVNLPCLRNDSEAPSSSDLTDL